MNCLQSTVFISISKSLSLINKLIQILPKCFEQNLQSFFQTLFFAINTLQTGIEKDILKLIQVSVSLFNQTSCIIALIRIPPSYFSIAFINSLIFQFDFSDSHSEYIEQIHSFSTSNFEINSLSCSSILNFLNKKFENKLENKYSLLENSIYLIF